MAKKLVSLNGHLIEKPPEPTFDGQLSLFSNVAEFSGRCRLCGGSIKMHITISADIPKKFWGGLIAQRLTEKHECGAVAEYSATEEYVRRHLPDMVAGAEKIHEMREKQKRGLLPGK